MIDDERPKHLDLFSGIGGFALAARWAGFETVAFCEADSRCREFIGRTWGIPVEPDIRKLDGRRYAGISLLTGGPPCQPASRAGKQGGEKDDRWLWGEALRVLDEAKPDCVVFENPPGILDVGIDGILSEMGRLGYEVQLFDIPACAVDSPHLRHRIWIVGFLADAKREGRKPASQLDSKPQQFKQQAPRRPNTDGCGDDVADTADPGRERRDAERAPDGRNSERAESKLADTERQRRNIGSEQPEEQLARDGRAGFAGEFESAWINSVWVPCADNKLRRAPDDSFSLVDGLHRSILGALGNSIVPQEAFQILKVVRRIIYDADHVPGQRETAREIPQKESRESGGLHAALETSAETFEGKE